jgi:hypothetical protein
LELHKAGESWKEAKEQNGRASRWLYVPQGTKAVHDEAM